MTEPNAIILTMALQQLQYHAMRESRVCSRIKYNMLCIDWLVFMSSFMAFCKMYDAVISVTPWIWGAYCALAVAGVVMLKLDTIILDKLLESETAFYALANDITLCQKCTPEQTTPVSDVIVFYERLQALRVKYHTVGRWPARMIATATM